MLLNKLSPNKLPVYYSICSISSCVLVALFEGVFHGVNNDDLIIIPFYKNYSTIIDFLILNPLTLYFLLRCFDQINNVYKKHNIETPISTYHNIGALIVSLVIAFVAMKYYYSGFLEGDHFDAFVRPMSIGGEIVITITGWVAFFWTALFIGLVLFLLFHYFVYLWYVLSLKSLKLYDPFHKDSVGGQQYLIAPVISFSYAMLFASLIFIGFILYDYLLHSVVKESKRIYVFIIYIIVVSSGLYSPVFQIRKLMLLRRKKFLSTLRSKSKKLFKELEESKKNRLIQEDIDKIELLLDHETKCKSLSDKIPIWPLPTIELSKASSGILVAIISLIINVIESFLG